MIFEFSGHIDIFKSNLVWIFRNNFHFLIKMYG